MACISMLLSSGSTAGPSGISSLSSDSSFSEDVASEVSSFPALDSSVGFSSSELGLSPDSLAASSAASVFSFSAFLSFLSSALAVWAFLILPRYLFIPPSYLESGSSLTISVMTASAGFGFIL